MSMLCSISGEAPQVPVVSRKSGNVYEKRIIEAYLAENATEPTTGEALTIDDLLEIHGQHSVRPRPPTLTSIPSLLNVFQEEWDALALETYTLQQNLAQTRQELSTALYQHDAAVRIIARLTKERDEARQALAKINIVDQNRASTGSNGDSMQVDIQPLPPSVVSVIEKTQESLTKTRRKRPVPEDWATSERVSSFKPAPFSDTSYSGSRCVAIDNTGNLALVGGADGTIGVHSISDGQAIQTYKIDGSAVCSVKWSGSKPVISTNSGKVAVFGGDKELASVEKHKGSANDVTVHPSGDILASVGDDQSYVIYSLPDLEVVTQVFTESVLSCARFHPDGHLLAVGGRDGQVKIFDVKSGALGAAFDATGPVKAVSFSENGTWLAVATEGSPQVSIWDLRKAGPGATPIKTLESSGPVESLDWDYSAQFLLSGGSAGVSVWQYSKAKKEWTETLEVTVPAVAVAWGKQAQSFLAMNNTGELSLLS